MRLSGRFLLAGATATAIASLASAQCPTANDCCTASPDGTVGCNDADCCNFICLIDSFCCAVSWDGVCAGEAAQFCTVCGGTPVVCPPNKNDCCLPSPDFTPGCIDPNCCFTVCLQDTFCCDVEWDQLCADAAIASCGICPIPCPPNDNSCFSASGSGTPGCNDPECCDIVCAIDNFCCLVAWDSLCASEAFSFCPPPTCDLPPCKGNPEQEECGQDTNGGCNVPIIGDSTCCQATFSLGCDDPDCQTAVCSVDPFCCDTAWDGICVQEALALCPTVCQLGTAQFEDIECNKTICGTAWADANFRDTDWFQIVLTDEPGTLLSVSIINQLPMVIGIVDTGGIPDCGLASVLNPFAVADFCGSASFEICLAPGTYWVFAAPNAFSGFPCGSGLNDYQLTVNCLGKCTPPACGISDHDCLTVGGPFCSDADCCFQVCGFDPFCCDVSWDQQCVNEANVLCYGGSICPVSDHDCFTQGGPGCTDTACCDQVCLVDSFCCEVSWDGICVNEAISICGAPPCEFSCEGTDTPEGEPCGEDVNGGCNMAFPAFGSISCGETICGNAWAAGGTRDTDWFQVTFDTDTEVIITIDAMMPMIAGPVATGGVPDCGLASFIDPFVITGLCSSGQVSTTLVAGTWWIFAAPASFDGFPCDSGNNDYRLTLECPTDCISRGADFNGDDCVDGDDLGTLLGDWGTGGGYGIADFNCDGIVDGDDLGTLLGEWGGAGCA